MNGKRTNANERMIDIKIMQKSKVKIQNYKSKVKNFFALLPYFLILTCTFDF